MVLRTKKPLYERDRVFKGRGGVSQTARSFHLYVFRPEGVDSLSINAREFVRYAEEYLDVRGGGKLSKAKIVLNFLRLL